MNFKHSPALGPDQWTVPADPRGPYWLGERGRLLEGWEDTGVSVG